jgi:hypothetical protein
MMPASMSDCRRVTPPAHLTRRADDSSPKPPAPPALGYPEDGAVEYLLQQTHTPMTLGHSHELLDVPLQGFGGLLLSLTQKHRNVEEADLTTSVTPRGLALAAR